MNKVLVTGATSGLGKSVAEAFLDSGSIVYIHGRSRKGLETVLKNPRCRFVAEDLGKPDKLAVLSRVVRDENIDCFVSNAGVYSRKGLSISAKETINILNVNLVSAILVLNAVYTQFRASKRGTIVAINSVAGLHPNFDEAVYCASKAGLSTFIKALQLDAYKHNVRILDYYPAALKTRMTKEREGFERFIEPADVAALIIANVTSKATVTPAYQELRRSTNLGG